jgi:hypothetical protein
LRLDNFLLQHVVNPFRGDLRPCVCNPRPFHSSATNTLSVKPACSAGIAGFRVQIEALKIDIYSFHRGLARSYREGVLTA